MICSAEFLQVTLGYQTLNIALSNIELTVLGQSDGAAQDFSQHRCPRKTIAAVVLPVFGLDLPSVLQHSYVNEQVARWFETSG